MSSSIARVTARMPHHITDLTIMQHSRHERTQVTRNATQPLPEIWDWLAGQVEDRAAGGVPQRLRQSFEFVLGPVRERRTQSLPDSLGLRQFLARDGTAFPGIGPDALITSHLACQQTRRR